MYHHDEEFWIDAVEIDKDRLDLLLRTFSNEVNKRKLIKTSEFTEYLEEVICTHELTFREKAVLFTIFLDASPIKSSHMSGSHPLFLEKLKSKYMPGIPTLRGINIALAVFLIGATFIQENWLALIAWISIVVFMVSDLLKERTL